MSVNTTAQDQQVNQSQSQVNQPESQVELNLRRLSRTEGVVKLSNGEEYTFSVFEFQGGRGQNNWKKVTSEKNWNDVALQVAEFFQKSAPHPFENASIVLSGNLTNINPQDLANKNVKIVNAEVSYKETEDAQELKVKTFSKTEAVAFKDLSTLADEFQGVTPSRSVPVSSQSNSRTENQVEDGLLDDRLTICERREHPIVQDNASNPQPYANFALADQLRQLPEAGLTSYQGVDTGLISTNIKTEVVNHINVIYNDLASLSINDRFKSLQNAVQNDSGLYSSAIATLSGKIPKNIENILNKNSVDLTRPEQTAIGKLYCQYSKDKKTHWLNENLNDIISSLKKAYTDDRATLEGAIASGEMGRLSSLLNSQLGDLTEGQKGILVNAYIEYIKQPNSKFVGPTFFRAFVEKHRSLDCGDFFQIVIVEKKDGKTTAQSYPKSDAILDSSRCAFLYFDDATGSYSSYNRQQNGLTNLNEPSVLIDAEPKPIKTRRRQTAPVPSNSIAPIVTTIEIDSSGRCLDASIAYQILRKMGIQDPLNTNYDTIYRLAEWLRTSVAQIILNDELDSYPAFTNLLTTSIHNIPEDKIPEYIKEILHKSQFLLPARDNSDQSHKAENARRKLRGFYAEYIINNNMKNSLDSAFIYILSFVNLNGAPISITSYFPGGLKVAVIQGDKIIPTHPTQTGLDVNQALFVNYNGTGHYQAVDMDNTNGARNKVSKVIIVSLLKDLVDNPALRQGLNVSASELDNNFQSATVDREKEQKRNILAKLIYEHDMLLYRTAPQGTEPGTTGNYTIDNRNYGNGNYGLYRIDSMTGDELKKKLEEIIAAINNNQIILN